MTNILSVLGSTKAHRIAAAVVGVLTAVSGALATYGSGFGLDTGTISLIAGALGTVIAAAHEVQNPVLLAFLLAKPSATTPTASAK